jgi:DNA-binding winged helix-turn-helix (wHTH) protein
MILRIGGCEIDCDRRQVSRDGAEQPLPRKAFDLLLVLLEKRPKVVTKELLIKRVWPDAFVADANLAILIGDVRAALGDDAKEPRIIRTHHRVGYSFAADVSEVSAEARDRGQPAFILAAAKRRILLFDGSATLGRDPGCNIVIDDPSVSRVHAVLSVTDGQLTVEDRDSKNGTRVDGRKLSEASVVRSGQRIAFGTLEAIVVGGDAPAGSTMTLELPKPDDS